MKGMSQVEIAVLSMKEGIIWIIGDSLMIWHWRNEAKNLRKKKFCYGCYSPMTSEHNAKSCKKRWKCQVCNLDYPTGLHSDIHKKKDGALTNDTEEKQRGSNLKSNFAGMGLKSASASITSNVICMCVVPVKLSYAGTKKQVSTYALLNNCSQGCFMTDSIRKNLGADGRKTEITIKTLNGEQKMKSTVMSGLKVWSDSDDIKRWLDLPEIYTKEELPADVEEFAARENDPEVKVTVTANINKVDDEETVPQILNRCSLWRRILRVMLKVISAIIQPCQVWDSNSKK